MSPSKFLGIPNSFSQHGPDVDHMIDVVHWFMIVLFVGWSIYLVIALIKHRSSINPKASYLGVTNHISSHIEIAVIVIEAVLLLGFAIPLWRERTDKFDTVIAGEHVRVRVIGWQFGWTYHYPGKDAKFGRIDPFQISGTNELGIDKNDPNSADDFTSPILKLPVQTAAILDINSKDVIHNYAIVPMRIQQDAIPGKNDIPMWFTPVKTLETSVVCAQLCGEGHGSMVGSMEVIDKSPYQTWADSQSDAALKASMAKAPVALR
jgi:cytochrome c oxidase subunit 2